MIGATAALAGVVASGSMFLALAERQMVALLMGAARFTPLLVAACSAGRSAECQPDAPPPGLTQPSGISPAAPVVGAPSSPQEPITTRHWVNPNSSVCAESPNASLPSGGGTDAGVRAAATTDDAGAEPPLGTITNAARVVAAMRARFRACYQTLLEKRDPRAAGRVRLAFRVDCEGRIAEITAQTSGVDPETAECMIAAVREDRFDPPVGGKAIVNVPVNLVRQTRKDAEASVPDAG